MPTGRKRALFLVCFAFDKVLPNFGMQVLPIVLLHDPFQQTNELRATQELNQGSEIGHTAAPEGWNKVKDQILAKDQKEHVISNVQMDPNPHRKKSVDSGEDQIQNIYPHGQYSKEHIEELQKLKSTIETISSVKTGWKNVYLQSFGSRENYIRMEAEDEYISEVMRGTLLDIFETERTESGKERAWIKDAYLPILNQIEPSIRKNLINQAKSDFRVLHQGSKNGLGRALQQIRVCLRKRPATIQERTVLSLGAAQRADFVISSDMLKLAIKIANGSRDISRPETWLPLSDEETELLEHIADLTVSVRRTRNLNALLIRFNERSDDDNPDDMELIVKATKELISKEKGGQIWTEDDVELMGGLNNALKYPGIARKKLRQMAAKIRIQKAYKVLKGRANSPVTPEYLQFRERLYKQTPKYRESHPDERIDKLTEEEFLQVKDLANQYYWMKEKHWGSLYFDPLNSAIRVMGNDVLSLEQMAIQSLTSSKERWYKDPRHDPLLRKLREGVPPIPLRRQMIALEEIEEKLKSHELQQPDRIKAKRVEQALQDTPEFEIIEESTEKEKAFFFDEIIYSAPLSEIVIWENFNHPPELVSKLKDVIGITREWKFLSFTERCKVLLYSKIFKSRLELHGAPDPTTIESLAFNRLAFLKSQRIRKLDDREMKIHKSLASELYGEICTQKAKDTIMKLALEEILVHSGKFSEEDQILATKLSENSSLSELDQREWNKKKFHLLPEEILELEKIFSPSTNTVKDSQGLILSRDVLKNPEFIKAFYKDYKFTKILMLLHKASERINLKREMPFNSNPGNFIWIELREQIYNLEKLKADFEQKKGGYNSLMAKFQEANLI
ncbi:hypothetical protein MJO28_005134 [Puccinia striiformis f. sp. tritici]|uniref:Uncharacterized protein n=1 Tax=Puccinia striiformis f. sp. tritici TaxID=168172 RepID=A0ACC0EJT7_9BASI|nr:hypothetical protein MJO28_005134 [Puccinia striiformis f. sp. tritici]